MITVTAQELQMLRWKSWHEKENLEVTSENRRRRCGCDMLAQTVPSTGSSSKEGPIADDGQPCSMDSQQQWGSRVEVSAGLEISRVLETIGETTVLSHADTCTQKQRAWTASSLVLSQTWATWPSSWPTSNNGHLSCSNIPVSGHLSQN